MNAPTEYQTIFHEGKPAFVLVPVADFERVRPLLERTAVRNANPQAVVEASVLRDVPLIRAWREHLGLTQDEVAFRAEMKQPALARLERGEIAPRPATLKRLAGAMGLVELGLLDQDADGGLSALYDEILIHADIRDAA